MLLALPAVCSNCGLTFASGLEMGPGTRIVSVDNFYPCPRCHASAKIPNGIYDFVDDILGLSRGDQRALHRMITAAGNNDIPISQTAAGVVGGVSRAVEAIVEKVEKRPDRTLLWPAMGLLLGALTGSVVDDVYEYAKGKVIEAMQSRPAPAAPKPTTPPGVTEV
jgi:hypothetical protein